MIDREMLQKALQGAHKRGVDWLTEFIKENPDVYRRGPGEYLTPRLTGKVATAMRQDLKAMDEDTFLSTLERLVEATSVEEAAQLLGGGRT